MRFRIIIPVFLIGLLLNSFKDYSVTVELTGRLKRPASDTTTSISYIPVFVKGNDQVLDKSISNKKGVFNLSWNDNGAKAFYFYCIVHKKDTLLLAKVSSFGSDAPDLTFYIPH
jgi:hypothetical protein